MVFGNFRGVVNASFHVHCDSRAAVCNASIAPCLLVKIHAMNRHVLIDIYKSHSSSSFTLFLLCFSVQTCDWKWADQPKICSTIFMLYFFFDRLFVLSVLLNRSKNAIFVYLLHCLCSFIPWVSLIVTDVSCLLCITVFRG